MSLKYTMLEKRELPELKSVGYLYSHITGASVLHIKNDDENKVFNVMFRTPPGDDTGLPHILEHCVLNGSEKYPIKDPFGVLMKGSLVTFLNAMTYNDKTMYPVASCNDKDFLNLMGVYLDSVYFPLIHSREHAFRQEGWHYDLESPGGELKINGVVYNEMKGATSDITQVLYEKLYKCLFPESRYRFNSGGEPEAIPNLTYEDFKEFHKTLYHPSNSFIYLYGNMDIDKCFDLLDEYLSKFENNTAEIKHRINLPEQAPHTAPVFTDGEYPIAEGDSPDGKNYIGAAFAMNGYGNPLLMSSMDALKYILLDTPASPLKNSLLEMNLGESVDGDFDPHISQPSIILLTQNSRYGGNDLKKAISDILEPIVKNGLDKKYVESCLNTLEFRFREKDYSYPAGLMVLISRLPGWIYEHNPLDYLSPAECISKIRGKIAEGEPYFENLIDKYILNNNFSCYVTLKARPGLQAQKDAELKSSLKSYKESLSEDEVKAIIQRKKELTDAQNTPDTPEALATIPIVGLEDIKKETRFVQLEEQESGGVKILRAPINTDGITYSKFIFDTRSLTKDEIPAIGIFSCLLGKLDTAKRKFADLTSEINLHLGGFETKFDIYKHVDGVSYLPVLEVNVKALEEKTPEIYSITKEILAETLFDDKSRIKMLLSEQKANIESSFVHAGFRYAIYRAGAYLSDKNAYSDLVMGYGYYRYLKTLLDDFDSAFEGFREKLLAVRGKLFSGQALSIAAACGNDAMGVLSERAGEFYAALPAGIRHSAPEDLFIGSINEAFIAESKVQYNIACADFIAAGFKYTGLMQTLANIINEGYLLQEIRVKGGAYGYNAWFNADGALGVFSYRDPNLERTYNVYKGIPAFIENFKPGGREMLQYVLGAINKLDKPETPRQKLNQAVITHMSGITAAMRQTERDELLSSDAEKIRGLAPMLDACCRRSRICTFGGESVINGSKDLFGEIIKL